MPGWKEHCAEDQDAGVQDWGLLRLVTSGFSYFPGFLIVKMVLLFKKLKVKLVCDLAISLLGMYLGELKGGLQETFTPLFIAALLTAARRWSHPSASRRTGR